MCLYVDDYEMPSVHRSDLRRARKEHLCDECRAPIPRGEIYEYVFGIWDGRPEVYKTHLACAGLRKFIVDVVCGGDGGWIYGGLAEACREGEREHLVHEELDEETDDYRPGPLTSILNEIRAHYTVSRAGEAAPP